jgi:glutaminase
MGLEDAQMKINDKMIEAAAIAIFPLISGNEEDDHENPWIMSIAKAALEAALQTKLTNGEQINSDNSKANANMLAKLTEADKLLEVMGEALGEVREALIDNLDVDPLIQKLEEIRNKNKV